MLLAPSPAVAGSTAEMEGQPDAEPRNQDQMDREREPAEDEWKSWQRGQVRNTLHLVSAAAQWILLLACLIYLGIDSLQPSTVRARVQPIVCWLVKLCMDFIILLLFFKKRKKHLGLSLFKPQVFNPFLTGCHFFFFTLPVLKTTSSIAQCRVWGQVVRKGNCSRNALCISPQGREICLPPAPYLTCSDSCVFAFN